MNAVDVGSESRAGSAALQAGNAAQARQHFEKIVAFNGSDTYHWLLLALSCKALNDENGMLRATERVLALDPRNLSALILKGDYLVAKRNVRAATQFYGVAVAIASQIPDLPAPMAAEIKRVADARDRINAHIALHLRNELNASGYNETTSSSRFSQSLAILTGRKQPYFQQPRSYFFPELPQIQFYPRSFFPWLDGLEAATNDICAELERILLNPEVFKPYIQTDPDSPSRNDHSLLDNDGWSAFFLWKDGEVVPEAAEQCPRTLAALRDVPLARIRGREPSVLFSKLRPGARIEPHTGFLNTRLICHLPLIVPAGCYFRVGNDERQWQKGKAWVFDDTIEHEAWNSSDQVRVVLIFDIWRPELSDEERGLVAALMEAVDRYEGGEPVTWDA